MALRVEHEMHRRRLGRNVGVGLALLAFVALMFALTLVKTKRGNPGNPPQTTQQQGSGN